MGKLVGPARLMPITSADVSLVADPLHEELNSRLSSAEWEAEITSPWDCSQQNNGFLLRADKQIVGVHLAYYSEREIDDRTARFCNMAAWRVVEEYRSSGLRLLNSLLSQKGYHFTDLSPSGNVVPLNTRLKFSHLDVTTAQICHGRSGSSSRVRIISEQQEIVRALHGRDWEI